MQYYGSNFVNLGQKYGAASQPWLTQSTILRYLDCQIGPRCFHDQEKGIMAKSSETAVSVLPSSNFVMGST